MSRHTIYEVLPARLEYELLHPNEVGEDRETIVAHPDKEPEIVERMEREGLYHCECGMDFGEDYDAALDHLEGFQS